MMFFADYLAHCEARLRRNGMASATVKSYRRILKDIWRPTIGDLVFSQVRYSSLVSIPDGHAWSKKTYNNVISALKRAFAFGYRDRSCWENPAHNLRCARFRKADRPKIRPSEQIALSLTDLDLENGIISIYKARVYGVDRCKTKTSEDRRIQLCPRALHVLKRHLRLRAHLEAAGDVDHDHVFSLAVDLPVEGALGEFMRVIRAGPEIRLVDHLLFWNQN